MIDALDRKYDAVVITEEKLWEFKRTLLELKASGIKIKEMRLYGHGRAGDTNLGDLWFGANFPLVGGRGLGDPALKSLFGGQFRKRSKIVLEFCSSAESPVIVDFFKTVAPESRIIGIKGTGWGVGDYGKIMWAEWSELQSYPK